MVDVYDFCELCTDDSVEVAIYDMTTDEEVFRGEMSEAKDSDYAFCDVLSFDVCPVNGNGTSLLILNIETDDEDEHD